MKDYIRSHFVSIAVAAAIFACGGHFMIALLRVQATEQRQEITLLMQTSAPNAGADAAVPTLGQIGQRIGGVFRGIDSSSED